MVANDLVDAFDHCKCNRTHINHHSVVKMPNKNSHFNRKHEVEFGGYWKEGYWKDAVQNSKWDIP